MTPSPLSGHELIYDAFPIVDNGIKLTKERWLVDVKLLREKLLALKSKRFLDDPHNDSSDLLVKWHRIEEMFALILKEPEQLITASANSDSVKTKEDR